MNEEMKKTYTKEIIINNPGPMTSASGTYGSWHLSEMVGTPPLLGKGPPNDGRKLAWSEPTVGSRLAINNIYIYIYIYMYTHYITL